MIQIHHILPQSLAGHFALKVLGNRFNLNGIKNLMALPSDQQAARELGSSPHTGGHLASYNKIFCKFLGVLQSHPSFAAAQEGDTAAVDQLDAEMSSFLAAAKHALARGHLLTNTPSGMTSEDANKRTEDWYANWKAYAEEHRDSIQQMQDTVDQLHAASQWEHALRAPILLPDGTRSLADKIAILARYPKGSPISQHFTAVGPVPDPPGLVPPFVDTRLPPFIPPSPGDLNRPEGFTPNPLPNYGSPGFPAANPQGFGQLPPTTAAPTDPLVLRSDPHTGTPLPFYDNSLAGGTSLADSALLPWLAGAAAVGAAAPFIPAWLLGIGGILALTRAANAQVSPDGATPGPSTSGGGVFSTGAPAHNTNGDGLNVDSTADRSGSSVSSAFWPQLGGASSLDSDATASTFAGRFGEWATTPAGTMPAKDLPEATPTSAAGSVAPDDVRRLTRVNEANSASVFTSGSAPVPYLPPTEFNDRFGNWTASTVDGRPTQTSRPIGVFADEPSYLIPPPIFGVDSPGNPHNEAEEWFSRWIRPMLGRE